MTAIPDSPQAFPSVADWDDEHRPILQRNGMTLRDWFAGQALANSSLTEFKPEAAAAMAYRYADAMLAARGEL